MEILNQLDESYLISDPRLISAAHSGQKLRLRDPTLSGKVCLNDVKTGYYKNYNDIRAGNITYYISSDTTRPFISYAGMFPNSINILYEDYIDPNGISKAHYTIPLNTRCNRNTGCLTYISDTNDSRSDLMAMNLWKRNQNTGFGFPRHN